MTLETAVYAVQRGGTLLKCKGEDFCDKIQNGDLFAVTRSNGTTYQYAWNGDHDSKIQDSDAVGCTDTDGVTKKITGAQFKTLFDCGTGHWSESKCRWHIIKTDTKPMNIQGADSVWNLATDTEIPKFGLLAPGEYMIVGCKISFRYSDANWQFGPKTDTSNVTDMSMLLDWCEGFNSSLDNLNTSKVTNFSRFMSYCWSFNSSIRNIDTSNATNLSSMFRDCGKFNQNVAHLKTDKAVTMDHMFTEVLDCPGVEGFNVSNCENLNSCFYRIKNFSRNLQSWDVSKCKDFYAIFRGTNNPQVSNWDLSSAENMAYFAMNSNFNQNISGWNVSNCTTMDYAFERSSLNQDLSKWCVSKISSEPRDFLKGAPMEFQTAKHPKWGTCP